METDGDVRSLLRAIFMSDHFRSEQVRYRKVKSPVELMVGTARLTGRWSLPINDVAELANNAHFMGQSLLNPHLWRVGTRVRSGSTALG